MFWLLKYFCWASQTQHCNQNRGNLSTMNISCVHFSWVAMTHKNIETQKFHTKKIHPQHFQNYGMSSSMIIDMPWMNYTHVVHSRHAKQHTMVYMYFIQLIHLTAYTPCSGCRQVPGTIPVSSLLFFPIYQNIIYICTRKPNIWQSLNIQSSTIPTTLLFQDRIMTYMYHAVSFNLNI